VSLERCRRFVEGKKKAAEHPQKKVKNIQQRVFASGHPPNY
jgi:hypothetical protein